MICVDIVIKNRFQLIQLAHECHIYFTKLLEIET